MSIKTRLWTIYTTLRYHGIPTKWEYIARTCADYPLIESTKSAIKLSALINKLYGRRHTKEWISRYQCDIKPFITLLYSRMDYCTACYVHDGDCVNCLLAHNMKGECMFVDSLYDQFKKNFIIEYLYN